MKNVVFAVVLLATLLTGCAKTEKIQYVYRLGRDVHYTDFEHFKTIDNYLSEVGYIVDDMRVFEGTMQDKCENEAQSWFESLTQDIDDDELCGMMNIGEYVKLKVSRADDDGLVVVAEKDYQGTLR